MSKVLDFFRGVKRPSITHVGFGQLRAMKKDGGGLTASDLKTVRRFSEAVGLPFTADVDAAQIIASFPAQRDFIAGQKTEAEKLWGSIARGLFVAAITVAVLSVLVFVGHWGPLLLTVLYALLRFGLWIAAAATAAVLTGGLLLLVRRAAQQRARKLARDYSIREEMLKIQLNEANEVAELLDEAAA